jgi:glutamate synthase (NADPH/NADH) small chain
LSDPDAGGRRKVEVTDSQFDFACDTVIPALGQARFSELLKNRGIDLKTADRRTGQTAHPKYYAGGDCVNGGREVVDAVADGKRAALAMIAKLKGAN